MEEKDYKLLDQYLQDELPDDQKAAFRQRIKEEEPLAEELKLRQQMHTYLRTKAQQPDLEAAMKNLGGTYFSPAEKATKIVPIARRRLYVGLGIAAAIALVLLVWNPFGSGNLYKAYAQHPPLALVEKGDALALAQQAEVAYGEKDYKTAYDLLNELTDLSSENVQLQLALGISALETGRTTKARQLFEKLAEGNSALRNYGCWYLALSYLKTEEFAQAKAELQKLDDSDPALYDKAAQLLEEL
ncbi:MAG: tetratricopeptide repeat protein [Lewinella sp.]|uniref:tetratricopeptide repeat protein n=1 Tax=Lewinella sp. TaxID=2004506 RepID=UPI003D6A7FCF